MLGFSGFNFQQVSNNLTLSNFLNLVSRCLHVVEAWILNVIECSIQMILWAVIVATHIKFLAIPTVMARISKELHSVPPCVSYNHSTGLTILSRPRSLFIPTPNSFKPLNSVCTDLRNLELIKFSPRKFPLTSLRFKQTWTFHSWNILIWSEKNLQGSQRDLVRCPISHHWAARA
jgi:hypothetical protein